MFLKLIVEINYWLSKNLEKTLNFTREANLSIIHPISVKYQNMHVHIFSVSRNLVRKGPLKITLSDLFVMSISQLSVTEFPKSHDGFMNETNGPIFSLFIPSFSLSSHKFPLLSAAVAWCRNRCWDSQTCCSLHLHSPTRFHLSSKQSYFTSKESDK